MFGALNWRGSRTISIVAPRWSQLRTSCLERGQIISGVPQGSIIGPLLFVLLMNDLPDCLTTCKTLMYADDTAIYCSSKNVHTLKQS